MIANDETLPVELLRELIDYDPQTGAMHWKPRLPKHSPSGYRTSEGNCANFNAKHAGAPALTAVKRKGYLGGVCLGFRVLAHRVAWAIATGNWPLHHIDHIDGNPANNAIANLRDVTNAVNHKNVKLQENNSTGWCGVRQFSSGKWNARIKIDGREVSLGTYATKAEAVAARKAGQRALGFHENHGKKRLRPPLGAGA